MSVFGLSLILLLGVPLAAGRRTATRKSQGELSDNATQLELSDGAGAGASSKTKPFWDAFHGINGGNDVCKGNEDQMRDRYNDKVEKVDGLTNTLADKLDKNLTITMADGLKFRELSKRMQRFDSCFKLLNEPVYAMTGRKKMKDASLDELKEAMTGFPAVTQRALNVMFEGISTMLPKKPLPDVPNCGFELGNLDFTALVSYPTRTVALTQARTQLFGKDCSENGAEEFRQRCTGTMKEVVDMIWDHVLKITDAKEKLATNAAQPGEIAQMFQQSEQEMMQADSNLEQKIKESPIALRLSSLLELAADMDDTVSSSLLDLKNEDMEDAQSIALGLMIILYGMASVVGMFFLWVLGMFATNR